MKAFISSTGNLIIRERGHALAMRPVGDRADRRALVDRANARLGAIHVTGDTAADWIYRQQTAAEIINEVLS